jgi:hypothetical protein
MAQAAIRWEISMPRRVGRPAVQRQPNERVPVATRLRGEIYNRLIEAATYNDRPIGNEIELRLEQALLVEKLMGSQSWRFGYYLMSKLEQAEWRAPELWLEVIGEGEAAGVTEAKRQGIEGDWTSNPACFEAAMCAVIRRLIALTPVWNGEFYNGFFQTVLLNEQRRRFGPPDAQGGFVDQGNLAPIIVDLPNHETDERPPEAPQRDENAA